MTALQKSNAVLPPEIAEQLVNIRATNKTLFEAWVIALREKRWPYRSIGDVFGVSRVAAQAWYKRALKNEVAVEKAKDLETQVPLLAIDVRGSQIKVVKLIPDVPPAERERLKTLTEQAREVGRWTPPYAPSRKAAEELEELIYFYAVKRKIPAATIARHAGVTRRAVVQRLEKQQARQNEQVAA